MDLVLEDLKRPILHSDQGYSQKGPEAGNTSSYYTQTRLLTSGSIQTTSGSYQVSEYVEMTGYADSIEGEF